MSYYNEDPTTVGVLHIEVSDVQELFDIVQEYIFDGDDEVFKFIISLTSRELNGRELDSITLNELSKFSELFPKTYKFTSAELLLMLGHVLDRIS